MSEPGQERGSLRFDKNAKDGSSVTEASPGRDSPSSIGKEKLSPLRPVPPLDLARRKTGLTIDVWLMVAERAHPYSVLQIARTNKVLRRVFISKELSSAIWKRALQNLEDFPNFQTNDFGGPKLVAFIYEDLCAVCKKGETDKQSYSMMVRLHSQDCEDKLIMQGGKLLSKTLAFRSEVLLCMPKFDIWDDPSWELRVRRSSKFAIDEARKINLYLRDHLSSSQAQDESAGIRTFIEKHQPRAQALETNGRELCVWVEEEIQNKSWKRVADEIFSHHRIDPDVHPHRQWIENFVKDYVDHWHFQFYTKILSEQGWNEVYYHMEKLFLSRHKHLLTEAQRQQQVKRRKVLHTHYNSLKADDPLYPPFSIFTELPSIRHFWKTLNAPCATIEEGWDAKQLRIFPRNLVAAKCWIRLSLARLLSQSLAQLWKPLSPDLYSSLHPEDYLLPPPFFDGIHDSLNSTGVFLDDPASISATELEELLDRFSNQAWFFDSQQPRTLAVTLRDNLDRISKIDYRGPLFPSFHKFWHQILSQVLEKSGIEDGPQGEVTQKLEDLGTCFSCGACGVDGEETGLMTAIELLKHFKDHGFPAEGTPQDSLVVYHPLEAQENDEGLEPR